MSTKTNSDLLSLAINRAHGDLLLENPAYHPDSWQPKILELLRQMRGAQKEIAIKKI